MISIAQFLNICHIKTKKHVPFDYSSQKLLNPTVSRIKYDLLYISSQKSTFSPLPTEKRFKIKPKPWEYDATDLVNKILEAKENNTDENNNSAKDNDD